MTVKIVIAFTNVVFYRSAVCNCRISAYVCLSVVPSSSTCLLAWSYLWTSLKRLQTTSWQVSRNGQSFSSRFYRSLWAVDRCCVRNSPSDFATRWRDSRLFRGGFIIRRGGADDKFKIQGDCHSNVSSRRASMGRPNSLQKIPNLARTGN